MRRSVEIGGGSIRVTVTKPRRLDITGSPISLDMMADRIIYENCPELNEAGRELVSEGSILDYPDVCRMLSAGEKMELLRAIFAEESL